MYYFFKGLFIKQEAAYLIKYNLRIIQIPWIEIKGISK
jgi:hypothetical protein